MKTTRLSLALVLALASSTTFAHNTGDASSYADVAGGANNTLSTSASSTGNGSVDVTAQQWSGSAGAAGAGVSVQNGFRGININGGLSATTDNWSGSTSSIVKDGRGATGSVAAEGQASGSANAGYKASAGRSAYLGQNAQVTSSAATQQRGQGEAFAETVNSVEGAGSVSLSGRFSAPAAAGTVSDVKTSASTAVTSGRHTAATTGGRVSADGWYGAGSAGNGGYAGNSGE